MDNNPLFSILIANYNNGKYFIDCYNSILSQSYQNWEAIIVDDCSTDNSVEQIKNIVGTDKRFKIFKNEQNSGVGFTKNRCIALANGELCAFVDPDDAIVPSAIEIMIKQHTEHPETSLIYSNFIFCNALLEKKNTFQQRQIQNNDSTFFNQKGEISHFAVFKKSAYNQTSGLDTSMKRAIDQDLYLKLYDIAPVKHIDKDLYLYRIHEGGISTNSNIDKAYFWHWEAIKSTAKRRHLSIEDIFLEKFERRERYAKEVEEHQKLRTLLKKSRWLKLGYKLGLFKLYKYL